MRESYTAVLVKGERWRGEVATEPYEAAWASEAVFFLRALSVEGSVAGTAARVQISADGLHWADEGTAVELPAEEGEVAFCRVRHFGGYLRLAANVPEDVDFRVVVSLNLKA